MKTPSRRALLIGSVAVLAAGGAVGGALAASGTFDPKAERQAFLNDVAGRLGVTSDKLNAALKGAAIDRVDAALAAGRITQAQADAIKAAINAGRLPLGLGLGLGLRAGIGAGLGRGPGMGMGMRFHGVFGPLALGPAATYLGLTADQLRTQLESGKSLADIAKAQGKSVDGLEQALVSAAQSKLDQAVKDGRITSAQRDQVLAKIKADIADLVNGTLPSKPMGFQNRFRFAPGGFHGPLPAEAPGSSLPTA
jgi:hypothetical protein